MSQVSHRFNRIGVIVGCDLVGDALLKLPFLRGLRNAFPHAEIHWITSAGATFFAGPLREPTRPFIDAVHEKPLWLATAERPATQTPPSFDLLIDTRNRWREALRARKIPHGVFIAPAMRFLFSDRQPSVFAKRPDHMVDRMLQTVELAAGFMPATTGVLAIPEDLRMKARMILPEGKTYVGLAPGAGNRGKIWPRENFIRLARSQAAKGRVPVFILGPAEQEDYVALSAALPDALFPLQNLAAWGAAKLGIEHTLAIAGLLDVAVSNDSGTGHMLAAADCPLISLFGPTLAEKLAPRVSRGRVIRAQSFGSAQISAIPFDAVDKAVDEMLISS